MVRCSALVAFLAALSGCISEASDITWHGDARFTLEQRAEIEASARWMTEHAGAPSVDIVWGPTGLGSCEHSIVVADLPAGTIGDSSADGCIRIDVSQGGDRVGVIVAHELAHVRLGPCHHHGAGLMNVNVPAAMAWTAADEGAAAGCGR